MKKRKAKSTLALSFAHRQRYALRGEAGLLSYPSGQESMFAFPITVLPRLSHSDLGTLSQLIGIGVAMVLAQKLVSLVGGVPMARARDESASGSLRHDELRWIQAHGDDLSRLTGQWIAVEGTELISHGANLTQVLEEVERRGIGRPFVYRVPATGPDVVEMGL